MSRPRKTLRIADVVDKVNHMNRESTCDAGKRAGWNALLESLLHDADAYKGYNNLGSVNVPEGHAPGIKWIEDGDGYGLPNFDGCDDTRRVYHLDRRAR